MVSLQPFPGAWRQNIGAEHRSVVGKQLKAMISYTYLQDFRQVFLVGIQASILRKYDQGHATAS